MESVNPRFCTNCGTPTQPGAAFCTNCGARLMHAAIPEPAVPDAAPAAPPTPAPQPAPPIPTSATGVSLADPGVERIVSAAGGLSMKTGMLKRTNYSLVMTNHRILFAQTTAEMLKQNVAEARDHAKSEGGGFFKQWGAQIAAGFSYADRYLQMTPEQVLAETPGNWALPISQVLKVKYKAGMVGDAETNSTPDRVVIKTAQDKYTLELTGGSSNSVRRALADAGLI